MTDFVMSLPAWVVLAALLAVLIFPFALIAWAALMFRPRDRWLEQAPAARPAPPADRPWWADPAQREPHRPLLRRRP